MRHNPAWHSAIRRHRCTIAEPAHSAVRHFGAFKHFALLPIRCTLIIDCVFVLTGISCVSNSLLDSVLDLAQRLPSPLEAARQAERAATVLAQGAAGRLDLVTRAEFDAQTEVLLHTRAKVEQLEQRVAQLIQQLEQAQSGAAPGHSHD